MSHRTVSWTQIDRAGRDSRPVIAPGIRDELNTNGRPVNDALLAELNAQHER